MALMLACMLLSSARPTSATDVTTYDRAINAAKSQFEKCKIPAPRVGQSNDRSPAQPFELEKYFQNHRSSSLDYLSSLYTSGEKYQTAPVPFLDREIIVPYNKLDDYLSQQFGTTINNDEINPYFYGDTHEFNLDTNIRFGVTDLSNRPIYNIFPKNYDQIVQNMDIAWNSPTPNYLLSKAFRPPTETYLSFPMVSQFSFNETSGNNLNLSDILKKLTDNLTLMTGGEGPNPTQMPLVDARIDCFFQGGSVQSELVEGAAQDETASACSEYSREMIDECFLPVISLVRSSDDPGNNLIENACAGTIIGPYHIVTAAHCTCTDIPYASIGTIVFPSLRAYDFSAFRTPINLTKVGKLIEPFRKARMGTSFLFPTKGKPARFSTEPCNPSKGGVDDLAVIQVELDIPFPPSFRAVIVQGLPTPSPLNLAGYGPTGASHLDKGIKRYISSTLKFVGDMLVVDSGKLLHNSCPTDSGSGAYVRLRDGRLGIVGVLSTGTGLCEAGGESSYVALSETRYRSFLTANAPDIEYVIDPELAEDSNHCIGTCRPESTFSSAQ